jgi:hypothetical protein
MIYNPQNPEIEPAVNEKFEARADLAFGLHQLSVTVFKEKMNNGFRSMNQYAVYQYKNIIHRYWITMLLRRLPISVHCLIRQLMKI